MIPAGAKPRLVRGEPVPDISAYYSRLNPSSGRDRRRAALQTVDALREQLIQARAAQMEEGVGSDEL